MLEQILGLDKAKQIANFYSVNFEFLTLARKYDSFSSPEGKKIKWIFIKFS